MPVLTATASSSGYPSLGNEITNQSPDRCKGCGDDSVSDYPTGLNAMGHCAVVAHVPDDIDVLAEVLLRALFDYPYGVSASLEGPGTARALTG